MVQKKNTVKGMGYFNLLRGIGILLIIWGHSASIFTAYQNENERLENGIYSVLGGGIMAMFFLISGYQFYKRSPQKCLHIQKRMLLYPYGITAVAVLLSKGILSVLKQRNFTEHGGEYLLTYLLGLNAEGGGLLWGIPIESVSILWFVLALFGGWMIYNGIMQCKSQWLRWSLISVCGVLAWLLGRVSRVWVFCLPQSLVAVFFLAIGAEIRQRQLLEKTLPWKVYVLMGILLAICARIGRIDMVNSVWKLGPIDIAGSACCGFLLLKGYDYLMQHVFRKKKIAALESAGFHSMWIICLHCYEKVIFPWYRLQGLFSDSPVLGTLVCMILRICLIYIMYRMLLPIKLCGKRIHGKRKSRVILEE